MASDGQRAARRGGAGQAGVHSPLTRAGRAALKVGAPPEGRWSRDAKGAYPLARPSFVASPLFVRLSRE